VGSIIAPRWWLLKSSQPELGTAEERSALAALRRTHPALAPRFGVALARAQAVGLGRLWVALAQERIGGIAASQRADWAVLLLPDGTRLSAPREITDAFAEHPAGLAVTLHGAARTLIHHPQALLSAVLAASRGRVNPDRWATLSTELAASVANHALGLVGESWRWDRLRGALAQRAAAENVLRWVVRRSAIDPTLSPLVLFEQAVVDGHPLHPCARIRGGMSVNDVFAYAPEWADEVALGLVAIANRSLAQSSFAQSPPGQACSRRGMTAVLRRWHPAAIDAALDYLSATRREATDFELLPVHPWQLRRVLPQRFAGALAEGRLIVIPQVRIPARPLLSLRTLAAATDPQAVHIKTAVDVRLTTAVRGISPGTVHNGPLVSALMAEIHRRERGFGGRFTSLAERIGASYRPAPGEPRTTAGSLAAILRESPERHVRNGEVALPVAALAARSPLSGRPVAGEVLDELARGGCGSPAEAAGTFLAGYCDCLLPALLTLLSRWGIALEPHGQNTVVVLCGGLPVRVLYRDFGGVRISPSRLAQAGVNPPTLVEPLLTEDAEELRARLFFPLVQTNLGQVVATLARVGGSDPHRLWRLVAQRCRSVYATLTADPAIAVQARGDEIALVSPTLPTKSMLRVHLSPDPHTSQWVAVPNPLAAVG
jgi:siderophore synthetase component